MSDYSDDTAPLIHFLYEIAALPRPEVIFINHPADFLQTVDSFKLKGERSVQQAIVNAVIDKLAQPTMESLSQSQFWSKRDDHYNAFWKASQSKRQESVLRLVQESFGINASIWSPHPHFSDYSWKYFVSSFTDSPLPSLTQIYFDLLEQSGFTGACLFEQCCLILKAPDMVFLDAHNKPHADEGYAIVYGESGICAWHGLLIPDRYIFEKTSLTKQDIISERNAERRRALREILGARRFAELLDIITIEQSIDRNGNLQSLFRTNEKDTIAGDYLYFAHVTCPSTQRNYFLSVPPDLKSAHDAVAWTFGLSGKDYSPDKET